MGPQDLARRHTEPVGHRRRTLAAIAESREKSFGGRMGEGTFGLACTNGSQSFKAMMMVLFLLCLELSLLRQSSLKTRRKSPETT